ncbi:chemotaxis protein CheX [Paenibacillus sp. y28]|uniref:chemotaxis protein CheX n=1 Tax=Paenibacillus sp. y28 TaxID=3129110 RepID=UPI00301780E8
MESNPARTPLFAAILETAERYLHQLGFNQLVSVPSQRTGVDALLLEDVTVFIQISGSVQGGFLFTADPAFARLLAKRFMVDPICDLEAAQYAVEVVAEVSNVIAGNALNAGEDQTVFLGNPLMILSRSMGIRAAVYEVQTYTADQGLFRCFFIPMMDKTELARVVMMQAE